MLCSCSSPNEIRSAIAMVFGQDEKIDRQTKNKISPCIMINDEEERQGQQTQGRSSRDILDKSFDNAYDRKKEKQGCRSKDDQGSQ